MASALKGLEGILAKKPAAKVVPVDPVPVVTEAPTAREMGRGGRPSKDDRVQIMVRMFPEERKALRQIALDENTTVQELVEAVVRNLITRYNGGLPGGHVSVAGDDLSSGRPVAPSGSALEAGRAVEAPRTLGRASTPPAGLSEAPAAIDLPGVRWPKGTTPDQAEAIVQLVRDRMPPLSLRKAADAIGAEIGVTISHEGVSGIARALGVPRSK